MPYPTLVGEPIRISARRNLCCAHGRMVDDAGTAVHAATFIRRRRIVLDAGLLSSDDELRRILIHELFHFVWARLANPVRRSWERLLAGQRTAPGELGWSAEYRKCKLSPSDVRRRSRKWREYCCEAFCDTAAYLYARSRRHGEFTLPGSERKRRTTWFGKYLGEGNIRM
jgi:hypothetical protein